MADETTLGTVVTWRVGGNPRGMDPSGRFWRRAPAQQRGQASRSGRAARILAGMLSLFVALGACFWLISLLHLPRPVRLVLVGAGYEDNLQIPHNAYGWRGLQDLAALSDRPVSSWIARLCSARYQLAGEPILLDTRAIDRWGVVLKDFLEPTIVVVMALHGGVDSQGPYLLPQDAKALPESPDRVRMTDVLRLFGRLPRYKKKVLILDTTGLPYHWELGMLRNDFARGLKGLESEIKKIPNFLVICASGDDQRSWVNESSHRTAFLDFLIGALGSRVKGAGALPTWSPRSRVNLEDVFDKVTNEVESWTAVHCNASQEPFILPSGDDGRLLARSIELPPVQRLDETVPLEESDRRSIKQTLGRHWKDYRQLATSPLPPGVADPIRWRRYQQLLRRYDELLRAVGPKAEAKYGDVLERMLAERLKLLERRTTPLTTARAAALTMSLGGRGHRCRWQADGPLGSPRDRPDLVRQDLVAGR